MKLTRAGRNMLHKLEKQKRDQENKLIYYAFVAFAIAFVIFQYLRPATIGGNFMHTLFIFIAPIIVLVAVFYKYRYKIMDRDTVASITNIWHKIGYSAGILLVLSILSLITTGLVANIIFEVANYNVANNNAQDQVIVPVDKFHKGTGKRKTYKIYFIFNGEKESIDVRREKIEEYIAKSNTLKHVKLWIRKGIWNHYLVQGYRVIP